MLTPFRGNCPGNVAKDAKYAVRSTPQGHVVALTYNTADGEKWYMTTQGHPELVQMVNAVKLEATGKPAGAFYINEYRQVIVPAVEATEYYLAGVYHGALRFDFEGKTLSGEPVDAQGRPLSPGDLWEGPRPGIPYVLAANGGDIYYDVTVRPNVTKRESLKKAVGDVAAARIAARISAIKGFAGGRFYVNEWGAMFTPLKQGGEWRYVYLGLVDTGRANVMADGGGWFPKPHTE